MRKLDSRGQLNPLMPALIISVLLLLGAAGFGIWAFMERQTYLNDYTAKLDVAVEAKKEEIAAEIQKEFDEREKSPFRSYVGPSQFGNVNVTYPKTWAAYVDESVSGGGTPVDVHFHPNFVPGINTLGKTTQYALQVQVLDQTFERVLNTFSSAIKSGKATSQPYAAPKVPDVVGARVTSEDNVTVLLPLRDKTLSIATYSQTYIGDFDTIILENITFQP